MKKKSRYFILSGFLLLFSIFLAISLHSFSGPVLKTAGFFSIYSPDQVMRQVWMTLILGIVAYGTLFILIRLINQRVENLKSRHALRKNASYMVNFLLIVAVIFVWLQRLNSLSIFLGFASAGLALALQEAILCIAGWFMIIARRPFEVGDRIEIAGIKGDVIDIRVMQTALLEIGNWVDADQSTGRIVNVPNSFVFKHANYNYNQGFEYIWNEIPLTLTFESDWRRGREIMISHAEKSAEGLEDRVKRRIDRMTNRFMIYYQKYTPIVYVDVQSSGVRLTLRYLTEAKKRRSTTDELSRAILDDFNQEPNVNLAYQTFRMIQ